MDTFSPPAGRLSPAEISRRAQALGDRFQNIDLGGVWTAPNRFPGDHPGVKYARFSDAIPRDVSGQTVLAIGCNAGFYSVEMKRRGAARVLGVESDERSLVQARFAAEMLGLDTEYRALSVYDVARLGEKFDVVIFMGVLYHLRHPLRARELIREHVARDLPVFQSMQRGDTKEPQPVPEDQEFLDTGMFARPDFPALYFIEQRYCGDPSNWWIPNRACAEAMPRRAGFCILNHPEEEVYICRVNPQEDRRP